MPENLDELDKRIEAQKDRLVDRPEPECPKSPTGKHDFTRAAYSRAQGVVCYYCLASNK